MNKYIGRTFFVLLVTIRFLSDIHFLNRSAIDRDVVDQRKTVTAQNDSENNAIALKKTADTSKQFTSRYNVVNGGSNKELYKGPKEELLL